jgi:MFS family permease
MQRTTFLPHVMLGQVILAFIIWVFAGGFITKKHPGNWFFLGIVGIVVGIVFPPVVLFMYGVLGFLTLAELIPFIKNKELGTLPKKPSKTFLVYLKEKFFGRVVFGLLTFPTLVYFALLTSEYPWKRLAEFDVLHPTKFSYMEYFLALGATLPLGLIGAVLVYLTPKHPLSQKLRIFTHWVFAWLFFVFLFNFIPAQSPTRWSEMSPHIPLSILTVYAVIVLAMGIGKIIRKKNNELRISNNEKNSLVTLLIVIRHSLFVIPILIILFGMGTMVSSWLWQKDFVDHKLRADYPLVPEGSQVMYPLKDIVDAMMWLQINTPRSAVVLCGMATGNLIPVYAGNTTMVGHANTVDSENKVIAIANFFGRKRPMPEFVDWFKKYKVQYIFYGPAEAEQAYGAFDLTEFYPFLSEVYKNKMVIVYKVNL